MHCHLCDLQFKEDLDEVIQRAKSVGVIACIVNTENKAEFERVLELSKFYKGWLMPCFGVHPIQVNPNTSKNRSVTCDETNGIHELIAAHSSDIVAIGEVGLDYTPHFIENDQDKLNQQYVFKQQIDLAKMHDLPLNVHSRSAGRPVIDFLLSNDAKNVVLHAFSGNYKSALQGINAGYYFSVPPCTVNSEQKQTLFKKIPLEQLLLETDSPVLGINKSERNEPANLTHSCQIVAQLKDVDVETVRRITTENALRLFPKLRNMIHL